MTTKRIFFLCFCKQNKKNYSSETNKKKKNKCLLISCFTWLQFECVSVYSHVQRESTLNLKFFFCFPKKKFRPFFHYSWSTENNEYSELGWRKKNSKSFCPHYVHCQKKKKKNSLFIWQLEKTFFFVWKTRQCLFSNLLFKT